MSSLFFANKLFVSSVFLIALSFSLFAVEPMSLTDWEYQSIRNETDIQVTGWKTLTAPGSYSTESKLSALRTQALIPSDFRGEKAVFELSRFNEGWMLYLNGVLIEQEGLLYDSNSPSLNTLKFALLPEELIRFDELNEILLVLYNDGGSFSLKETRLNTYEELYPLAQLSDFLNIHIYISFFLISAFIFLYYLMRFLMNRDDRSSLYFALANLALSIYFLEMGATFPTIGHQLFYKISKAFLPLFFTFLTLFFLNYFKVFNNRLFKIILSLVGILGALSILIFGTTSAAAASLFNLTLLPGALQLFLMFWISIRSVIKGNRLVIPILMGVIVGISTAVIDISYVVRGIYPLFYIQGFGILAFDIAMFMSLAYESLQISRNLDRTYRDNLAKSEMLQNFLSEMGNVSKVLAGMNTDLSSHVRDASGRTDILEKENASISTAVEEQFKKIQENSSSIKEVLEDFTEVQRKLETQDSNIRETSTITVEMLKTFDSTVEDIKTTTQFTEHLRDETASAEQRLVESTQLIESIQKKSKDITSIIDAMEDIAARTNLLAINASIEAAHAGIAGKGFAVVAQEIKKLANNSASRASDVITTIDEISELIQSGVQSNAAVKEALTSITADTESALQQISGIYEATQSEKAAGVQIINAMQSLTDFSEEIAILTTQQEESGLTVKKGLESLILLSRDLKGSLDRNVEGNSELVQLINDIDKVAEESAGESRRLNQLLAGNPAGS